MTARRWKCPRCGRDYRWHRSNIAMAHKCNPKMRQLVELALVDDDDDDDDDGDGTK